MAGSACDSVIAYLDGLQSLLKQVPRAPIDEFAALVFRAWRDRRRVYAFGNGGSAHTASHLVTDLVKTAAVSGRPRLRAVSLVDNVGLATAIGNDISYDQTLCYPLESYAEKGDIAVAISCSGNSPNVLRACEWARGNGLTIVALTELDGGALARLAHVHVNVPGDNYGMVEDVHLSVCHVVAQILHARMANES